MTADLDRAPRLLGFLMTPGPAEHLVPVERMTVLYGLNGAGKSTALGLVRGLCSGSETDRAAFGGGSAAALVRLGELPSELNRSWFSTRSEVGRNAYPPGPADLEAAFESWVADSLQNQLPSPGHEPIPDLAARRASLLAEWKTQRLVLIHHLGDYWVSWPAIVTCTSTPVANAELATAEESTASGAYGRGADVLVRQQGRTPEGGSILGLAGGGNRPTEYPKMNGVARHLRLPNIGVRLAVDSTDLGAEITDRLTWWAEQLDVDLFDHTDLGTTLAEPLTALLHQVVAEANTNYSGVLQDAPELGVSVVASGFATGIRWHALTSEPGLLGDPQPIQLDLGQLSSAQRRWAHWAINDAITRALPVIDDSSAEWDYEWDANELPGDVLTIIDEPERALHRSAESQMASFLTRTASPAHRFLVATHSPDLLNEPGCVVTEVKGGTPPAVRPMTSGVRDSLTDLGLTPSDLLRSQRGFILVEGQHDLDVLEIVLGDEFRRLRVDLLPLRGATQLSAAHARFLFDYTRAHVFVVLDNLRTELIAETWRNACELRILSGVDASREALLTALTPKSLGKDTEIRVLTEFLSACLDGDDWSRLTPIGLSKGDIIEYLPVDYLVDGSHDWQELRTRFDSHLEATSNGPRNFKAWLRGHGGRVTDDAVREAALAMDQMPQDFVRLMKTVEAAVT